MSDIVDLLRDTGCNREPFTPDHAACICRLTNSAADEIERLRLENAELRACFNAASMGMDHRAVFKLITEAKTYVAAMREAN